MLRFAEATGKKDRRYALHTTTGHKIENTRGARGNTKSLSETSEL
jgi:hypothetical protein